MLYWEHFATHLSLLVLFQFQVKTHLWLLKLSFATRELSLHKFVKMELARTYPLGKYVSRINLSILCRVAMYFDACCGCAEIIIAQSVWYLLIMDGIQSLFPYNFDPFRSFFFTVHLRWVLLDNDFHV